MEQISVAPPPLPPKTKSRRSPPEKASAATVLSGSAAAGDDAGVFNGCRYPEDREDGRQSHVVKIRINPDARKGGLQQEVICDVAPCIRISVNSTEMVQNPAMVDATSDRSSAYFFYNTFNCGVMSSGQVSPSDTLDSGTCSDLDGLDGIPPPLPKKKTSGVSVTLIGANGGTHKRAFSLTSSADSDDNESSLSCDSLNSGKCSPFPVIASVTSVTPKNTTLPQMLLQDIRNANNKLPDNNIVKSYEERKEEKVQQETQANSLPFDSDMFYNFHLNEHAPEENVVAPKTVVEDETFAGYKDILADGASTIRSAKGTVRGVKNRVRAGIATFLQINSTGKSYKEKDAGKVVVYTTTMGILRDTYQACMKVKQILRTLLVKFEERDVFMSSEYQSEIRERMRCDYILVPQVFVDGQHVGDAETVERLNETGELRRILKPFKSVDACSTCPMCGGYRLLPCQVCNGSKKSVHRNHFTAEFVALKCMNCDEVGLVRCTAC